MEPYIDTARLLYGPHDGGRFTVYELPSPNEQIILEGPERDSLYCFSPRLSAWVYVRSVLKVRIAE